MHMSGTRHSSDVLAYVLATVAGASLWLGTSALTGRREAWDASAYWSVAYPLGVALSAGLGFMNPVRPWRWGLVVMLAQAVTLTFTAAGFGLLPLGLILFGILAVPPMIAARLAAWMRR